MKERPSLLWALVVSGTTLLLALSHVRGDRPPLSPPTSPSTPTVKKSSLKYDEAPENAMALCGRFYAAVSPLLDGERPANAARYVEINWDFSDCENDEVPHRAAIYTINENDQSPFDFHSMRADWNAVLPSLKGHLITNYKVHRFLPGFWDKGENDTLKRQGDFCFHFRAVLFTASNFVLETDCLRIRPTWMTNLGDSHNNLALTELMLPGTHNSGSFSRDGDVDSHMVRYLLTQDLNMWEQLAMGVRYFDMRVGFYPQDMGDQQNEDHPDHGQRFWVNHDMVRVQPLRPMLEELREFLKFAPGEAVVLDFHRFPVGFSSADEPGSLPDPHEELIALIKEILGDIMIPNDKAHLRATLHDLATIKKNVVVSYNEKNWQAKENKWLWPPIPQQWGNQQTTEGLIVYLDRQVRTMHMKHYQLWAMMAELTPTMFDILLNLQRSSLRFMADQVNRNITAYARQGYWFNHANIIAVDYIESTDLVSVAIASNQMRSKRSVRERDESAK